MQLGISSYTYGWNVGVPGMLPRKPFSEKELLSKAADFGVSILQVGDNLPLHEFGKNRLADFKGMAKKANVRLEIGARGLTRENLSQYIEITRQLGAGMLRFVIDTNGCEPSPEEVVRVINGHVHLLQAYRITLALENHDRFKASIFMQIIEEINSKYVGICLDTANSLGAGEGINTVLTVLAPYTVNLHIKDFGIERLPHKMGFLVEGRIAGNGMLDIPGLIRTIKSYGRCHSAILEQWVPPLPTIENTIKKEEEWARKSIDYLFKVERWENSAMNSIHQNNN